MAETTAPSDRWPPIHFYRHGLLAIIFFIISAAAFICAVFLYTYCIPGKVEFGASGCVFPHLAAAGLFLVGGFVFLLLGILSGVMAWVGLEPERYRKLMDLGIGLGKVPDTPPASEATEQTRNP